MNIYTYIHTFTHTHTNTSGKLVGVKATGTVARRSPGMSPLPSRKASVASRL